MELYSKESILAIACALIASGHNIESDKIEIKAIEFAIKLEDEFRGRTRVNTDRVSFISDAKQPT